MVCACVLGWPAGALADEVVVKRRANLYSRPTTKAAVRLTTTRDVPVRLVRRRGGWLEVQTMTNDDPCPTHSGSTDMALRLFVRAADLAKATQAPVTRRFADGSSIRLRERLVLSKRAAPLVRYATRGTRRARVVRRRSKPFSLVANATVPDGADMKVGRFKLFVRPGTDVRVLRRGKERSLIRFVQPCMSVVGWVDAIFLAPREKTRKRVFGVGSGRCGPLYYVRSNTPCTGLTADVPVSHASDIRWRVRASQAPTSGSALSSSSRAGRAHSGCASTKSTEQPSSHYCLARDPYHHVRNWGFGCRRAKRTSVDGSTNCAIRLARCRCVWR